MHNRHATAIVVAGHGILIEGASGSGKTMLAFEALSFFKAAGLFACFISDDQVFLSARNGRLIVRTPTPIAGLAEARGLGPAKLAHMPAAVMDLVVRLVDEQDAPRFSEGQQMVHEGIALPCVELPQRQARRAVHAIAATLQLPPFGPSQVTV
ncbi:HPr kinase/phosphorylase [Nitratireductor aquimarinus]|uniref:HPr kinase/phosphorylase n=1 Tax=Nitratireductor TaxID=245876 RepID=UPI001A8FDB6B|nr:MULTISPECIES: HPr kinase/phosphorylase [Nitratireductor]MBN8244954.1 HPr kinase/phosphorylase [Nitratireductor aquimarinus]MBY6133432.1 HPr kinase/phosphorylase [Nitratireductor aquimarinus]MCA1303737.1 HPr kinase/phosphorylase [Nitratireductor aquimarinus]MCV0351195.1 HPr kinase/phosphorylase [Nitratireductor sp.]